MRGTAEKHALINDPAVRGEALKFLFAELQGITTIQFAFPVAVVAMYWDYVDNAQLLGWMVSLVILYALWQELIGTDQRAPETTSPARRTAAGTVP